jgi:small subunit ribosomal protein S8
VSFAAEAGLSTENSEFAESALGNSPMRASFQVCRRPAGKFGFGPQKAKRTKRKGNMSFFNDPIADMLTRIRNALRIRSTSVNIQASKVCEGVAAVLKSEGYILDYDRIDDGKQGILRIVLKYDETGQPVIDTIKRVSKLGRRVYSTVDKLPNILGGMGISIVSTSKGVMSDRLCRQANIGGEILCTVY